MYLLHYFPQNQNSKYLTKIGISIISHYLNEMHPTVHGIKTTKHSHHKTCFTMLNL